MNAINFRGKCHYAKTTTPPGPRGVRKHKEEMGKLLSFTFWPDAVEEAILLRDRLISVVVNFGCLSKICDSVGFFAWKLSCLMFYGGCACWRWRMSFYNLSRY